MDPHSGTKSVTCGFDICNDHCLFHAFISGQISADDSLFYYNPLFGPDTYRDENFIPVFEPPTNLEVLPEEVIAVCNGDEWCLFDYQATGDMEVAMASRESFEEQSAIVEASMNGMGPVSK